MIYLRTNTQKQMNKWNTRIYYVFVSTKKYIKQKKKKFMYATISTVCNMFSHCFSIFLLLVNIFILLICKLWVFTHFNIRLVLHNYLEGLTKMLLWIPVVLKSWNRDLIKLTPKSLSPRLIWSLSLSGGCSFKKSASMQLVSRTVAWLVRYKRVVR